MCMFSYKIDYKNQYSDLCKIGAKYDTDKSPARINGFGNRHIHPYTLFYSSLFKTMRGHELNIAEIGIFYGSSINMWKEYFPDSKLFFYDNNIQFIKDYELQMYEADKTRIKIDLMDVKNSESIINGLKKHNVEYDCIIDDSTHDFHDQVRIIYSAYKYTKPGGIMIIEDVFEDIPESEFRKALESIMDQFQDVYFVTFDHVRQHSYEKHKNNKILVLIRNNAPRIFFDKKEIVVVTPCCRVKNLQAVKKSIPFEYVCKWIIIYDGNHVPKDYSQFSMHANIEEHVVVGGPGGISGNPQRNYGMDIVEKQFGGNENMYLYFLDDDNLIHPDFHKLLNVLDCGKIYTFNQHNRIRGNELKINAIDTAMFLVALNLCHGIRWIDDKYNADGFFICECAKNNMDHWIYLDNVLAFYNKIQQQKYIL